MSALLCSDGTKSYKITAINGEKLALIRFSNRSAEHNGNNVCRHGRNKLYVWSAVCTFLHIICFDFECISNCKGFWIVCILVSGAFHCFEFNFHKKCWNTVFRKKIEIHIQTYKVVWQMTKNIVLNLCKEKSMMMHEVSWICVTNFCYIFMLIAYIRWILRRKKKKWKILTHIGRRSIKSLISFLNWHVFKTNFKSFLSFISYSLFFVPFLLHFPRKKMKSTHIAMLRSNDRFTLNRNENIR